jgi:hypothetical protein
MTRSAQPGRNRPQPQRTCVACRQKSDKRQFTRIVRTDQGISIDPTGKRNGRGAYLCDQAACWERAVHKGLLDTALKTHLTAGERATILAAAPPNPA